MTPSGDGSGAASEECGRQDFNVARKPVDILLVLDRSASMKDDPSGGSSKPTKWDIVVPALQQVITATDSAVSWGLKVFPQGEGTGTCTTESFPSDIAIPIAAKNAMTVNQKISKTTDEGDGTPTGDAINKGVEYLQTIKNDHVKYLLLATDGDPSCPKSDADEFAVQAITAAAAAVSHLRGRRRLEREQDQDPQRPRGSRARAAQGPGPARAQVLPRRHAGSARDLLQAITGAASTCVFPLSSAPPNPAHVGVSIGDKEIMKDTTDSNGWDYAGPDMTAIKLFGQACEEVQNSGAGTLKVIFGCKDDPIY